MTDRKRTAAGVLVLSLSLGIGGCGDEGSSTSPGVAAPAGAPAPAPGPVSAGAVLELAVKKSIQRENLTRPGYFDLPELLVFNPTVAPVLHLRGFDEDRFRDSLESTLKCHQARSRISLGLRRSSSAWMDRAST